MRLACDERVCVVKGERKRRKIHHQSIREKERSG